MHLAAMAILSILGRQGLIVLHFRGSQVRARQESQCRNTPLSSPDLLSSFSSQPPVADLVKYLSATILFVFGNTLAKQLPVQFVFSTKIRLNNNNSLNNRIPDLI